MIVVDTSALMAIVLDEPSAEGCRSVLLSDNDLALSAVTLAEALIVARRRGKGDEMQALIRGLPFEVAVVTQAQAQRAADVYDRWGKGIDPAGLNFADCFAYALARDLGCPLLFVGSDFARTDVVPAPPSPDPPPSPF